jgi:hypothetical protein
MEIQQESTYSKIELVMKTDILVNILTFLPASLNFLLISKELKEKIEQPNNPLGRKILRM